MDIGTPFNAAWFTAKSKIRDLFRLAGFLRLLFRLLIVDQAFSMRSMIHNRNTCPKEYVFDAQTARMMPQRKTYH